MTEESIEKPLFSPKIVSSPDAGNTDFEPTRTTSPKPEADIPQAIRRRTTFASTPEESRRNTQPRSATSQSRGSRRTLSLKSMLTPTRRVGDAPGVLQSLRAFFFSSWLNVLLVCIPISWALNWALPHSNPNRDVAVFTISFLAIIPLAKLLGVATDELSMRVGQTLAGLINATLGNAVELIVAIIALTKCELQVVQSSLVGSILSNLLLVLGMCFFCGGLKYSEQGFGHSASQVNSSLLTISVIAVLLPAAFDIKFNKTTTDDTLEARDILAVSHGVAILLLVMYAGFLTFQLYSHANLYEDEAIIESVRYKPKKSKKKKNDDLEKGDANGNGLVEPVTPDSHTVNGDVASESSAAGDDEEEEEVPTMNLPTTIVMLIFVTVIIAFTAEWLVNSIDGLVEKGGISKEFVGLILLPIVGNAAEHVTAVTVSVKDKLTLSIGVAVGSSIQIALFVIPFIVTLAWILGKPLTLLFDPYESITLFLAVLTVNYTVQDGKSNWLEGVILIILYVILAVTFWYYPGTLDSELPELLRCHH